MWPIAALLLLPLVEIGLFVTLGGALGLWGTLAFVIGSAVLGVMVLRRQNLRGGADLRAALARADDPAPAMARLAMTAFGAVLMIVPGFLTTAAGVVLLLPPVQGALAQALRRRGLRASVFAARATAGPEDIIEGDYTRTPEDAPPPAGHLPRPTHSPTTRRPH